MHLHKNGVKYLTRVKYSVELNGVRYGTQQYNLGLPKQWTLIGVMYFYPNREVKKTHIRVRCLLSVSTQTMELNKPLQGLGVLCILPEQCG